MPFCASKTGFEIGFTWEGIMIYVSDAQVPDTDKMLKFLPQKFNRDIIIPGVQVIYWVGVPCMMCVPIPK